MNVKARRTNPGLFAVLRYPFSFLVLIRQLNYNAMFVITGFLISDVLGKGSLAIIRHDSTIMT
jgi:hypothetical protein